jgi:hypothetical protein
MPKLEDLPHEAVADAVARAVVESVAEGGDTDAIVARALATVRSNLGLHGDVSANRKGAAGRPAPTFARGAPARPTDPSDGSGSGRSVVSEADVLAAARAGDRELRIPRRAIVTALARDVAHDAGVALVEGG